MNATDTAGKNALANWLRSGIRQLAGEEIKLNDPAVDEHFLPNFCQARMVVSVVFIGLVLAVLISLVMTVPNLFFSSYFEGLVQITVFVQWIALSSALVLCAARRYLRRLPNLTALLIAYLMLLAITVVVNEGATWVLWASGRISTPHPVWYGEFHIRNLAVSAIIDALVLSYFLAKQELKLRTISEAEAKMQALQSRIRPHFVFNTMNIIASLTRSEPAKAETAIEDMSEIFRMMLNDEELTVPIKREIAVAEKYLAIESLRLDNRLQVQWDVGTFPRKAVVPILTLQPLLETAISQGVEPLPAGGTITVRLREQEEQIHLEISSPAPPRRAGDRGAMEPTTIQNMRQRLNTYCGALASVNTRIENGQYTVRVVLPMRLERL